MEQATVAQSGGVDSPLAPSPVASFEALYKAELTYVWHSLRRLGMPPAELEDCVHQVFLTAWRRLRDYDPRRPLRPWLFGIAFRVASDWRGLARERHEVLDEPPEVGDERSRPDRLFSAQQEQLVVARVLDGMEVNRRVVFIMKEILGHDVPDIADAMGIPLPTAYSRLRLAREEFVTALRKLKGGVP